MSIKLLLNMKYKNWKNKKKTYLTLSLFPIYSLSNCWHNNYSININTYKITYSYIHLTNHFLHRENYTKNISFEVTTTYAVLKTIKDPFESHLGAPLGARTNPENPL
jgi:hypothetical protein